MNQIHILSLFFLLLEIADPSSAFVRAAPFSVDQASRAGMAEELFREADVPFSERAARLTDAKTANRNKTKHSRKPGGFCAAHAGLVITRSALPFSATVWIPPTDSGVRYRFEFLPELARPPTSHSI